MTAFYQAAPVQHSRFCREAVKWPDWRDHAPVLLTHRPNHPQPERLQILPDHVPDNQPIFPEGWQYP